ncbi:hypothetical protein, partial [Stenotrophomonas lactitubi]
PAHGEEKEDQEQQRVAALVGSARMKRAAAGPLFVFAFALLFSLAWVDAAENCQRPEGWGRAGYPRHGWRG